MNQQNKIFELNSYTLVDLVGIDSEKFLQGQLSIDVNSINQDAAKLCALCNHKGRIVSLFHIFRIDGGFRLILPKEIVDEAVAHLKKYAVFFKLEIKPAKDSAHLAAIQIASNQLEDDHKLGEVVTIPNTSLSVFSLENSVSAVELAESLDYQYCDNDDDWYWQLALNRIPWLTADSVEQFLPHNLDLPKLSAVDFNKGCFTGQEVIARMQYKGKLKQHMQLLKSSQQLTLSSKDKLNQADKSVGEVICSTYNGQETLVLALIKDRASKNESFQLNVENSPILNLVE